MRLCLLFMLIGSLLSGYTMAAEQKTIYGYVEKATLVDKNLQVSAKMDTGAKSASLSATHITPITINGKPYLRFIVSTKQGDVEFTGEHIGHVKIKVRAGENGKPAKPLPIERPVVLVKIRIGDKERQVPVNLANRKRFLYPLLLGRDAIKLFSGIIDPSIVFSLRNEKVELNEVK